MTPFQDRIRPGIHWIHGPNAPDPLQRADGRPLALPVPGRWSPADGWLQRTGVPGARRRSHQAGADPGRCLGHLFLGTKMGEWTRFFLDQKGLVGLAECCLSPKPTFISCLVSAMIWEKTLLHSKPMFWCDALIYFHGVSLGLLAGPVCHFLGAPTWQVCGPSMVSSRAWEVLPVPASSVPGAAPRRRGNLRYL